MTANRGFQLGREVQGYMLELESQRDSLKSANEKLDQLHQDELRHRRRLQTQQTQLLEALRAKWGKEKLKKFLIKNITEPEAAVQ
ncbi:hypothetical protein [Lentzea sp. NBRC 102530]|uniref:hypothetical protein n=1 Tax=Lentzea sp. NBRC 102530 TaxID=3032201 RepID=UPI0024A39B88|nr:hypothetical protein [Lentzea sp. NBRC 102530]GLY55347.1 hypothetical protein Lesp01_90020 [Lentzea sp. NBRC 102530]